MYLFVGFLSKASSVKMIRILNNPETFIKVSILLIKHLIEWLLKNCDFRLNEFLAQFLSYFACLSIKFIKSQGEIIQDIHAESFLVFVYSFSCILRNKTYLNERVEK